MAKIDILSLASALTARHGLKKSEAQAFIKSFIETLSDGLRADKQIKIKQLGTFKITSVSARKSVNVSTGESIILEGRDKITFTPEKGIADLVNKPFAQFETTILADDVDFKEINEKYHFDEALANEDSEAQPVAAAAALLSEPEKAEEPVEPTPAPVKETVEKVVEAVAPAKAETPKVEPVEEKPSVEKPEPPVAKVAETTPETAGEEPEGPKKSRWWLWLLLLAAVLVIGGYIYCRQSGCLKSEKQDKPVIEEPVDSAKLAAQEAEKEEALIAKYNEHPMVKTGAWRIEGIDQVVKVLPGQTFKAISKAYLGNGMECYVEAVNDGKNTVEPGDEIKIPKLISKREWLKQQNQ